VFYPPVSFDVAEVAEAAESGKFAKRCGGKKKMMWRKT
jgi:hypothetical protein